MAAVLSETSKKIAAARKGNGGPQRLIEENPQ